MFNLGLRHRPEPGNGSAPWLGVDHRLVPASCADPGPQPPQFWGSWTPSVWVGVVGRATARVLVLCSNGGWRTARRTGMTLINRSHRWAAADVVRPTGQEAAPGASAKRARSRSRRSQRAVAGLAVAALGLTVGTNALADTKITKTNPGKLAAVGPVNSVDGFPSWYGDSNGLRLEPCLDGDNPLCGFLPGDIPDDSQPISFPDNFPEEFFYQLVGSELDLPGGGRAVLTLGLEAAFANGPAEVGQQVVFARTRIVVKGAPANQTLTFTHPFGAATIDTDGTGAGRLVNDVSPAIGNFTLALGGNFGPFL